jgi:hypothetical protein
MGYGVDEESTYAQVAARALQARVPGRVEPVNLGVGGTGPLEYAEVLARWGPRLRPDAIVVGLCRENDLNDCRSALQRERVVQGAPSRVLYVVRDAVWRLRHAPRGVAEPGAWRRAGGVENPLEPGRLAEEARARGVSDESLRVRIGRLPAALLEAGRRWEVNPYLLQSGLLAPGALRGNLLGEGAEMEQAMAATREALRRIRRLAARIGAPVALVVIPASVEVSRAAWAPFRAMGYVLDDSLLGAPPPAAALAAASESLGFHVLDLLADSRAASDSSLYYRWDDHWNARGHALAGARLASALAALPGGTPLRGLNDPAAAKEGTAPRPR